MGDYGQLHQLPSTTRPDGGCMGRLVKSHFIGHEWRKVDFLQLIWKHVRWDTADRGVGATGGLIGDQSHWQSHIDLAPIDRNMTVCMIDGLAGACTKYVQHNYRNRDTLCESKLLVLSSHCENFCTLNLTKDEFGFILLNSNMITA